LSEVKGAVQLDRNTGVGFEQAMPNLPIVEGNHLQTGTGVAEVEFEDNSTLRLAPDTVIDFPELELLASGAKRSTINVQKGMAYVSLVGTKGNEFTLLFGQEKLRLQPSSHIRLQMDATEAKLAVWDGSVQIEGPSGTMEINKKNTLAFNLTNPGQPAVAKNVAAEPTDAWDKNAADYHKRYASMSAFGNSSYNYGVSDMLYYGNFSNAGGCGSMWRPYFVSTGWEPYANGAWAWYPNAGYSWVSPYPWGWTPFHSGNWSYCEGAGWGWQPGNSWNGLTNVPAATTVRGQPIRSPRAPARPPLAGQSTLVAANLKPLTSSALDSRENFTFRNDSAGLGVPRGSLGKLDKVSQQTMRHGSVSMPVYSAASIPAQSNDTRASSGLPSSMSRSGNANGSTSTGSPAYSNSSNNARSAPMNSSQMGGGSNVRAATSSGRPR
jgi:FecR protein